MKKFIITLYDNNKKSNKESIIVESNHENLKSAREYAKILKEKDGWGYVMVQEPKKEFTGLLNSSLQSLLDNLKSNGITDFTKVEFETDYSGCYYEGDTPGIMAVVKD